MDAELDSATELGSAEAIKERVQQIREKLSIYRDEELQSARTTPELMKSLDSNVEAAAGGDALNQSFVLAAGMGEEDKEKSVGEDQVKRYFGDNYDSLSVTQKEKIAFEFINKDQEPEPVQNVRMEDLLVPPAPTLDPKPVPADVLHDDDQALQLPPLESHTKSADEVLAPNKTDSPASKKRLLLRAEQKRSSEPAAEEKSTLPDPGPLERAGSVLESRNCGPLKAKTAERLQPTAVRIRVPKRRLVCGRNGPHKGSSCVPAPGGKRRVQRENSVRHVPSDDPEKPVNRSLRELNPGAEKKGQQQKAARKARGFVEACGIRQAGRGDGLSSELLGRKLTQLIGSQRPLEAPYEDGAGFSHGTVVNINIQKQTNYGNVLSQCDIRPNCGLTRNRRGSNVVPSSQNERSLTQIYGNSSGTTRKLVGMEPPAGPAFRRSKYKGRPRPAGKALDVTN